MSNLIQANKENWMAIKEQADAVKKAGLLPSAMSADQAAIIVLKGQELGVGTMRALEGMFVVNGKVAMDAKFMMSLIRERCPQAKITVKRKDEKGCIIEATRPHQEPELFQFLEADAQRAQLIKPNSPWTKYPSNMYWARTVSQMARQLFSDILGAAYVPEEIGGEVHEEESRNVNSPRQTLDVGQPADRTNILRRDSSSGKLPEEEKEEIADGLKESTLNERFAPTGASLAVTSTPATSKKVTVQVDTKTGEVPMPYPPAPAFDENEELPFGPDKVVTHWDRLASAGPHSGKTLRAIYNEVGKDAFIKMHATATKNIAKMGGEGKPVPENTMQTYKDLEACLGELL